MKQFSIFLISFLFSFNSFADNNIINRAARTPTAKELRAAAKFYISTGKLHLSAYTLYDLQKRSQANASDLANLGSVLLQLNHFELAENLAQQLRRKGKGDRSFPTELRAVLAISALNRGQTYRARQLMPPLSSLAKISGVKTRNKAIYFYGMLQIALGRQATAMKAFAMALPDTKDNFFAAGLVRLQRARIFYEKNQIRSAMEELVRVFRSDPAWHQGYLLSSWGSYRAKDYNLTLGQLMTLRSPYLVNKYMPEIHTLEAATLYKLCYYESAGRSIAELRKRYDGLVQSIDTFRRRLGMNFKMVAEVLNYARGQKDIASTFPKHHGYLIMDGILTHDHMILVDQSVTTSEKELDYLQELQKTLPNNRWTRAYIQKMSKRMEAAKRDYYRQAIAVISRRLNQMRSETSKILEQSLAIQVEINFRIRDRLVKGTVPRLTDIEFDAEVQKGYEFWPYEGEFWRDELGGYFFVSTDVCDEGIQ